MNFSALNFTITVDGTDPAVALQNPVNQENWSTGTVTFTDGSTATANITTIIGGYRDSNHDMLRKNGSWKTGQELISEYLLTLGIEKSELCVIDV